MRKPLSLLQTILLRVLPLTICLLLVFWFITRTVALKTVRTEVTEGMRQQVKYGAEVTAYKLQGLREATSALAANDIIINGVVDTLGRATYLPLFFQSLRIPGPENVHITITDYRGRPIASNRTPQSFPKAPQWLQQVMTGHSWFALTSEGLQIVQPVVYEGSTEGALVVAYTADDIFEFLAIQSNITDYVLLDSSGLVLHSSNLDLARPGHPAPPINTTETIAIQQGVPGFPKLVILALATTDQVFGSVDELNHFLLLAMAIYVLALVLGLVITTRTVTTPLSTFLQKLLELPRTVQRPNPDNAGTGDIILQSGPAEFQALFQSFNTLRGDLQHTTVSRDYVDNIIQSMTDSLIVLTLDGTIQLVNPATCTLLGYNEAELFGKPINLILHAQSPFHAPDIAGLAVHGIIHATEVAYTARDGRSIPVIFSGAIMRDNLGNRTGIVCVAQDITARKQAEQALWESEERFRSIVETSIHGLYIHQHGVVQFANPALATMLGYDQPDDLVGQPYHVVVAPHEQERLEGYRTARLRGEPVPTQYEYEAIRKDGSLMWMQCLVSRLVWNGAPAILTAFVNLSERKQMETALLESEQRYRDLVEHGQGFICTHDMHGVFLSVNLAGAEALGYESDELIGRSLRTLLSPSVQHLFPAYIERIRTQPTDNGLMRLRTKDGQERLWIYHNVRRDEEDKAPYVLGHAQDITERERMRQQLRESEVRKSAIMESALDGIITIDHTGTILEYNPAAEAIFGWRREEVMGQCMAALIVPPEHHTAYYHGLATYLQTGEGTVLGRRFETTALRADGSEFPIELAITPIQLDDSPLFTAFIRDITERKQTEAALAEAQEHEATIASRIQQTLLLGRPLEPLPGLQMATLTIPSEHIDGDFYECVKHTDHCVDILIGDVMGKGVPAALVGAALKSQFLRALGQLALASKESELPSPAALVNTMHTEVTAQLIALESFATLYLARFDVAQHRVTFVDCGHTRTMHFRHRTGMCQPLQGPNMPLGFSQHEVYTESTISFDQGDIFVLYSDGITETQNAAGELFGEDRLAEIVHVHSHMSPDALIDAIHQAVVAFSPTGRSTDDLTCLVLSTAPQEMPPPRVQRELAVTSDLSELAQVRAFVRSVCEETHHPMLDEEHTNHLELAVNEAVSNIMQHAYHDTDQPIDVSIGVFEHHITIRLAHWGDRFLPARVATPAFDGSQDRGFGLFLLEQFMDDVQYTSEPSGVNVVHLVKYLSTPHKELSHGHSH